MREGVPRFLLVLTAVAAIAIICLAIKDYVQGKKEQPPADTNTPTIQSNATTPRKKTSAEIKRARRLATNAAATAQAAGNEMEKPLISEGNAGAKAILAKAKRASAQAAHGEAGAIDQNNEVDTKITSPALTPAHCLPLPNSTNLADVDAPYYTNWSREYWCYDSIKPATAKPKLK